MVEIIFTQINYFAIAIEQKHSKAILLSIFSYLRAQSYKLFSIFAFKRCIK